MTTHTALRIEEFEQQYRQDYAMELASCDRWIKWCEKYKDDYGTNFHQGMRAALVFSNIKIEGLIASLKRI